VTLLDCYLTLKKVFFFRRNITTVALMTQVGCKCIKDDVRIVLRSIKRAVFCWNSLAACDDYSSFYILFFLLVNL
jgi:hypothetical protein